MDQRISGVRYVEPTLQITDIPRPLDNGDLKSQADPKERDFLFPSPFDSSDHALGTALSEPARYDNAPTCYQPLSQLKSGDRLRRAYRPPGIVIPHRIAGLSLWLQIGRINPLGLSDRRKLEMENSHAAQVSGHIASRHARAP